AAGRHRGLFARVVRPGVVAGPTAAGADRGRRPGVGRRPVAAPALTHHLLAPDAAGVIEPVLSSRDPAAGASCRGPAPPPTSVLMRTGRPGCHARLRQSLNHLSCGSSRRSSPLHSPRELTPSRKLPSGGATRKAITVATAIAAVAPGGRRSTSFSAGPNEALRRGFP